MSAKPAPTVRRQLVQPNQDGPWSAKVVAKRSTGGMTERKIRTMDEFAAASGLSRPTISKYFNDPASVRKTTKDRIEKALKNFDYRPNIFAINLNRKKPRIIGMIVPYTTDPFYAEVVRNIEIRCIQAGYLALVLSSHGEPELEARAIQTLQSLKVAGAIVAPLGFNSDVSLIRNLQNDIPIVFFDSRLDEATTFVGTDNSQSISLIVEYLCRTGERPSFFEMPHVNCNAIERRAAYLQTMARLGLQPELISPGSQQSWNFEEIGYTEALRLIDSSGFPTRTVLCANDRMAFGVMAAAYQRRLKIGREDDCNLRIAGHDDHPLSRYACPPLTTVAQDYDRLGTLCTETLLAKISDDTEAGKRTDLVGSIRLEGKLVMRSSA